MVINYRNKYLKYKQKYMILKNQFAAGKTTKMGSVSRYYTHDITGLLSWEHLILRVNNIEDLTDVIKNNTTNYNSIETKFLTLGKFKGKTNSYTNLFTFKKNQAWEDISKLTKEELKHANIYSRISFTNDGITCENC